MKHYDPRLSAPLKQVQAEYDRLGTLLEGLDACQHKLGVRAVRDEHGDVMFLCAVCGYIVEGYLAVPEGA